MKYMKFYHVSLDLIYGDTLTGEVSRAILAPRNGGGHVTIRADVLNRQAENTLSVKMEIVQLPQAMAKDMMGVEKKGAAAWVFGQR